MRCKHLFTVLVPPASELVADDYELALFPDTPHQFIVEGADGEKGEEHCEFANAFH